MSQNTATAVFPSVNMRGLLVSLTALLVVYAPTLWDLIYDWYDDPNYSHGFFIPFVSAWLIWRKRDQFGSVISDQRGRSLGLLGLLGAVCLFATGNGAAEYFTVRVSFVIALASLALYFLGSRFVIQNWFAFAFLLFMIPLPYVIYYAATFPLQLLATKISIKALNIIGIAALREGNIIHLSGIRLEVAEACSGIRSMISLLALGAIYAHFGQSRPVGKLLLFLSTIPIAIVTNAIRVFIMAVLSYTIEAQVTEEPLHSILGLSIFVIAFILLFIVSAVLKRIFK